MSVEKELRGISGWGMVIGSIVLTVVSVAGIISGIRDHSPAMAVPWIPGIVLTLPAMSGFAVVNPHEARLVTLFGVYKGTMRQPGFWWVNPLTTRRRLSLRIRNFESSKLKVNDRDANPIEIGAVVVWRLVDTFEAAFNVDDYENFMHVQTEAALRNLATSYPYDAHDEALVSLRLSAGVVAERLCQEIQNRLTKAGIEVSEARISHLAYALEIAGVMLRRQQAAAVISAQQKIVEGAVGMVEMALQELSRKGVVTLDEERKAAMVSNLMVVLCSDRGV
jgi:regulator of protease activity HflC (stomatin/prohibitin superfamily)